MTKEELIAAAREVRSDPRWLTFFQGKNEGLYTDMTAKYGKALAREVWAQACLLGSDG